MDKPLWQKRIVVTRPADQAGEFAALLRQAGALPILFPTIRIAPISTFAVLDQALHTLSRYDWVIFTSVNGVQAVLNRMDALHLPLTNLTHARIAVIGSVTQAALAQHGITASLCPPIFTAEGLLASLLPLGVAGRRFLLLRADLARPALRESLAAHGALVEEISVYHTLLGQPSAAAFDAVRRGTDAVTFTSASTVRNFVKLLGSEALRLTEHSQVVCIGTVTAQAAQALDLRVDCVAAEFTTDGLLQLLKERFST
jgi:uroporphyrinogen III methyltransferase/synthase